MSNLSVSDGRFRLGNKYLEVINPIGFRHSPRLVSQQVMLQFAHEFRQGFLLGDLDSLQPLSAGVGKLAGGGVGQGQGIEQTRQFAVSHAVASLASRIPISGR